MIFKALAMRHHVKRAAVLAGFEIGDVGLRRASGLGQLGLRQAALHPPEGERRRRREQRVDLFQRQHFLATRSIVCHRRRVDERVAQVLEFVRRENGESLPAGSGDELCAQLPFDRRSSRRARSWRR